MRSAALLISSFACGGSLSAALNSPALIYTAAAAVFGTLAILLTVAEIMEGK